MDSGQRRRGWTAVAGVGGGGAGGGGAPTLEEDAYLAEVFARLHEVIGEVAETRWAARGPRLVAAAVRVLAREQARLDAAYLGLLGEVEGREDVVPRVRGGSSRAAAFARASWAWTRGGPAGTPTPPA